VWALTRAGVIIENRAQADYVLGGLNYTAYSVTTQTAVAELVDVNVTPAMGGTTAVTGPLPASGELLYFAVTNAGNSTEEFALTADPAVAGDDFDPDNPVVALDSGNIGSFDGTGTDTIIPAPIPIPAETTIFVWVISDILDTPLNPGDTGRLTLEAVHQNAPISTVPGIVYPGAGAGGTDLVLGASGGYSAATGAYVIMRTSLILDKTVSSIAGTVAGVPVNDPIPGAVITYQLDVIVSGTGTAYAVTVTDSIPVDTTYVPGSMTLDPDGGGPNPSTALTDADDYPADPGQFTGVAIRVRLGDLTAGTRTITFQVTID
jgi:uncharacterized repeat protein (TIGR01451 family)